MPIPDVGDDNVLNTEEEEHGLAEEVHVPMMMEQGIPHIPAHTGRH